MKSAGDDIQVATPVDVPTPRERRDAWVKFASAGAADIYEKSHLADLLLADLLLAEFDKRFPQREG
jgi:hypothetical protein